MAAGETHVADLLDVVYHEMDRVTRGHNIYA